MIPLTELALKVREFADLCLPDHNCTDAIADEAGFQDIDFDEDPESPLVGHHIVLKLLEKRCLFTDWCRSQLLSHLGTREKWFATVTKSQQAHELTKRVHTFAKHRLRIMRSLESDVFILRGLVSEVYAEIPDTDIMAALLSLMPEGKCIGASSEKTQRALYVYAVSSQTPIGLRGQFMGYPGVLLKNSEVGYTSLWMIPFLYVHTSEGLRPLVFRNKHLLRRIHRGSVADLRKDFEDALAKLSAVWGPITERLGRLRNITFATEDEAVERLRNELTALKATKGALLDYERTYRATGSTVHDGLAILQAVLTTSRGSTADAGYDEAELAGALLLRLL